jgi:hypothetical protein
MIIFFCSRNRNRNHQILPRLPISGSMAEPINKLLKKNCTLIWTNVCQQSFKRIIHSLTHPPVLIYPDFSKDFILETDASIIGLDAVLAQKDKNGLNPPIAYGSRMLKDAEKNYSETAIIRNLRCGSGVRTIQTLFIWKRFYNRM